jgi:hypothetical protein
LDLLDAWKLLDFLHNGIGGKSVVMTKIKCVLSKAGTATSPTVHSCGPKVGSINKILTSSNSEHNHLQICQVKSGKNANLQCIAAQSQHAIGEQQMRSIP